MSFDIVQKNNQLSGLVEISEQDNRDPPTEPPLIDDYDWEKEREIVNERRVADALAEFGRDEVDWHLKGKFNCFGTTASVEISTDPVETPSKSE